MYRTKIFENVELHNAVDIDRWLNSFRKIYIVGYKVLKGSNVIVTVWEPQVFDSGFSKYQHKSAPVDIDQTYEEKTIE